METWREGLRMSLVLREPFLCGWLGFLTQQTALLKGCIATQFFLWEPWDFPVNTEERMV